MTTAFMRLTGWTVAILIAAAIPAVATAWLHPRSPYAAHDEALTSVRAEGSVTLADVEAWSANVLWIDARSDEAFERGHVPGAISLNDEAWDEKLFGVFDRYEPGDRLVVYCGSEACGLSQEVARRLREESGINEVYVLQGGWDIWKASR